MPYKDKEQERLRQKRKVDVECSICGKTTQVRYDTSKRYSRFTCSKQCKSILLKQLKTAFVDEQAFIQEYQQYELGYQKLCQKYGIGGIRGKEILNRHNVSILSSVELKKIMFQKGLGNWARQEERICQNCGNTFSFRKAATQGLFCSHKCYMQYQGRTSIEIKLFELLTKLDYQFIEQYKIERKYYDFYLPKYQLLIECDGVYWHSLPKARLNDRVKDNLAYFKKYRLIRFTEDEINNHIDRIEFYLINLNRKKENKKDINKEKLKETSWITNNNKEGE